MTSWSHFLPDRDNGTVGPANEPIDIRPCFRKQAAPAIFVGPSIDSVIIRSLSSSPFEGMSQNPSDASVDCISQKGAREESFPVAGTNLRRNLTEAFEELYTKPSGNSETPSIKQTSSKDNGPNMISPTGVSELRVQTSEPSPSEPSTPQKSNVVTPSNADIEATLLPFDLHPDLKRELSDALVNRVSLYSVIHDINKEASAMASNDDAGYCQRNPEETQEHHDPLIVAVNGQPSEPFVPVSTVVKFALIDEEKWLLDAIDARDSDETCSIKACPPTFLQAMGERDYENPLASLSNGSRTQLWKPSRSWWEAKSGKNPWIEPKSHNKRWRYLWPLIHYHKFLARCIKKLKRNGVDVKTSVSPVSVFLREEVCAVSDHLASVSLFDSDEWMACLQYFNGWTIPTEEAEATIRQIISQLRLRPLTEPGDVDSPLLRSQIDEQYLRAMAVARAQMVTGATEQDRRQNKEPKPKTPDSKPKQHQTQGVHGHPPSYPKPNASPATGRYHQHGSNGSPAAMRRARWGYLPQQGWPYGWNPHHGHYTYGDDVSSVQSGLSADSYPQHYDMNAYAGTMHHGQYYHPQMMYPSHHDMASGHPQGHFHMQDPSLYMHENCGAEHMAPPGWVPPGQMGHIPAQLSNQLSVPGTPGSMPIHEMPMLVNPQNEQQASEPGAGDHTPYKYNPNQVPMSPYWGHLDHATLALMGIATPQGPSAPQTPARGSQPAPAEDPTNETKPENYAVPLNAQPLLLRQPYYQYGYGSSEGYGPPSPATQFMMSPQAGFGYNYNYGFSPSRSGVVSDRQGTTSPTEKKENEVEADNTTSSATALGQPSNTKRESPVTVSTSTDSESLS